LLSLYEATFQERWLHAAIHLADSILGRFCDEAHEAFYDTAHDQEALVIRPKNIYDNALPSGPAAAAFVLLRLVRLTGNSEYEKPAAAAIRSMREFMIRYPLGFGHWLCALDFYLSLPKEIAVVGRPGDPAMKSLMRVINGRYLPDKVLAGRDPDQPPPTIDIPLLENRGMIGDRPTVYLCEGYVCQTPTTDPDSLATLLDK